MTASSKTAAELTWPQVHAFRLQRHHLDTRAPKKQLTRVVGDIGGAQAQVMSAAELQVASRVNCRVADVRTALWTDRTLVKTWLMRGTLHLIPAEDLPLYTAAMSGRWMRLRPSWLKYMQTTESEFWKLANDVGAALDGEPLTREELIAIVGKGQSPHIHEILRSGWGGMLKPAARSGLLCFGPSRGTSVTFVSPREWLGRWRDIDPDEAIVEIARRYLRTYGPATRNDFARWWGAWPGAGQAAWSGLARETVSVSIDGVPADLMPADLDVIRKARLARRVMLLPSFDPYLMGYATRDHLVDKAFASKVSRIAGWISAVVLVDGRIAGTWTHVQKNQALRLTVERFANLDREAKSELKDCAEALAEALGATDVELKLG